MYQLALCLICCIYGCGLNADSGSGHSVTTIGTLKPNARSQLGPQASGKMEAVYVDVGDQVKKDEPLAKLSTTLLKNDYDQKQSAFETSQVALNDAELNFNRMKKLWDNPEGPSISQKRFEDAESGLKLAKLQTKQAQEALVRAQIILDDAVIKAPYDGIITKRLVDAGEAVTSVPATQVVEIQSIDPLYLEFSIPENYLKWLHANSLLSFETEAGQEKHTAVIERIYPHIDEATRTVKCRAIIANQDKKFRPGSLVKVELHQP